MTTNVKITPADRALLIDAISNARYEHDGESYGLSAARRIHGGGEVEWVVCLHGSTDHMTHLGDEDRTGDSNEDIATYILVAWDTDWDDIQSDDAVGDNSIGSSDFRAKDVEQDEEPAKFDIYRAHRALERLHGAVDEMCSLGAK